MESEHLDPDFISEAQIDLMFANDDTNAFKVESDNPEFPLVAIFTRIEEGKDNFEVSINGVLEEGTAKNILKAIFNRFGNRPDLETR